MVALKAHEVARFVEKPDLPEGIVLVYGPDSGMVREIGQKLSRRFAGDDADSMNLVTFEGAELDGDAGRLEVEARSVSLFGDRRVIRVRNAGKSLVMGLTALLDRPGGALVVLEAGNLAPKDALRAQIEGSRHGRALPCYPDTEETLGRLISETFATAGIRVEPDSVSLLRDLLGNDREVTRRELEKLCLFAAESHVLSREDILTLCADNAALVMDEILDATGTGHPQALDAALARAIANSVAPQQILIMAMTHFSNLRRWRLEVESGKGANQVLESVRPKPHFSRRSALERQLRLWSEESLSTALERLQAAVSESRRHYEMQEAITRRSLLALCVMATQR